MPICRNFQKNLQTAKKDKMAFHLNLFFQLRTVEQTRTINKLGPLSAHTLRLSPFLKNKFK